MPLEKLRACSISRGPIAVKKKIVSLIGKDKFLNVNLLPAQRRRQLHSLQERDFGIGIALDQENG